MYIVQLQNLSFINILKNFLLNQPMYCSTLTIKLPHEWSKQPQIERTVKSKKVLTCFAAVEDTSFFSRRFRRSARRRELTGLGKEAAEFISENKVK